METSHTDKILEDSKIYLNQQIDLLKLNLVEEFSKWATSFYQKTMLHVLLLVALFFISFALAFYLGNLFGAIHLGFLCLSGIYFLLVLILYLGRKTFIKKPVRNFFIRYFIKKTNYGSNKNQQL